MSTRIENGCRIDFSAAPDVLRDGTTDSVDCPSILLKKSLLENQKLNMPDPRNENSRGFTSRSLLVSARKNVG